MVSMDYSAYYSSVPAQTTASKPATPNLESTGWTEPDDSATNTTTTGIPIQMAPLL